MLEVCPRSAQAFTPDQLQLLEALSRQVAAALDRARLVAETQRAQLEEETERLRNSLLSSVSHDLCTP